MSRAPRCLTTAMSHGASRTASSIVGEITGPPPSRCGPGLAAPAEDHEVGFLLRRGLHDAGRGVAADPDQRVDDRALGRVVQHLLEQPPGLAGAGRALGQRHPLRHLDDAQRGELAGPRLQQRGADPDQLLRGERVRDRDQDPAGERLPGHEAALLVPALDEVRLEQLELARLALDALLGGGRRHVAVLDHEAADPAEVDRRQRRDELAGRRPRRGGWR